MTPQPWAPASGWAHAGPRRSAGAAVAWGGLIALAVVGLPWGLVNWLPSGPWTDLLLARSWVAAVVLLGAVLPAAAALARLPRRPVLHWVLGAMVLAFQCMSLRAGPLNLLNLCIVGLASCWLADLVLQSRRPRTTPALSHLPVLLAALAVVSLLQRPEPSGSLRALLMLLPKLGMVWLLLQVVQTGAQVDRMLRLLVAVSVGAALLGTGQAAAYLVWGHELHLMEEFAPRYITAFGWPLLRASGLMPNPQAYAYPLLVAGLWLWYQLFRRSGGTTDKAWMALALLVIAAAYVLSFARGAWLAFAAVAWLVPALARPRLARAWFVGLAFLALTLLASGTAKWMVDSFGAFTASSADVRVELMDAGLRTVAEHPWRGVGLNRFDAVSPTFERYPVHNATLQLATELGLFALAVYAWLLLAPLRSLAGALRTPGDNPARHRYVALALGHVALLVAIQGDPMAYSEFVFFMVALLEAARRAWRRSEPQAPDVPL